MGNTINLWEYPIYMRSITSLLKEISASEHKFYRVVTLNPQMIVAGEEDARKKNWLCSADYLLPDGHGVTWALKRKTGVKLPVQTGVAFVEAVLNSPSVSVYFFGGSPEVQVRLKEIIPRLYPAIVVSGIEHGYHTEEENRNICREIAQKKPDFILIGMGYPKQEAIIDTLSKLCASGCAVGVGGVFDVVSGIKTLAPAWIRRLKLEWLYRGIQEPKRIRGWGYLVQFIRITLKKL